MPGLRSGSAYVNTKDQLGRRGHIAGNVSGTKANKKPRRSGRNDSTNGTDPNEDKDPSSDESGYDDATKAMKSTRSTKITCLRFGKDRRALYPKHDFCIKCDTWEQGGFKRSAQRDSRRNRCDGKHTRPDFPTALKQEYAPSHCIGARYTFVLQKDEFEHLMT
jgi:hypothetical protein